MTTLSPPVPDHDLLARFAGLQDHAAMEQLFVRHAGLVHALALRESKDPALADDITQAVFIVLMRRAGEISPHAPLPAWLFTTTRFALKDARKLQRRRQAHEQEAARMSVHLEHDPTRAPDPLDPAILHAALAKLSAPDRNALLLRYFQNASTTDLAAAMNTSEDAARQRLSRALTRLRKKLVITGITAAALAATLESSTAPAAAPALVSTFSAMLGGAAPSSLATSIAQGVLNMLAHTKWIACTAGGILAASVLTATIAFAAAKPAPPAPAPAPPPVAAAAAAPATMIPALPDGLPLADVEFQGNDHIDSQVLLDQLETQPPLTLGAWVQGPNAMSRSVRGVQDPPPYSKATVDRDLKRLESLGLFSDVKAEPRTTLVDQTRKNGIIVRFIVKEKPLASSHAPAKTPKGTVQAAFASAKDGDATGLTDCFEGLTQEQSATLHQITRLIYAFTQLARAMETHYGPQVAAQFPLLRDMGANPADIDNATETLDGDQAVVDIGRSGPGKLPMKKIGDVWKIDAACLETLNAENVYSQALSVPRFTKVTQQILDGQFADPRQAMMELQKILHPQPQPQPTQLP